MTPRERAIESLNLLRQNAWKRNATYSQCFLDDMADIIEQAILADRQTLQSEIEKRLGWLRKQDCEKYIVYEKTIDVIQSVFARQSQPEESKPKIQGFEVKPERGAGINYTPFDPSCSTCVREAKEEAEEDAKKNHSHGNPYDADCAGCVRKAWERDKELNPYTCIPPALQQNPDRIATLHEWQAQDQKTIQELNASNNALSEKIAQLEKEKYELIQKLNPSIQHRYEMCGSERCPACAAGFSQ